MAPKKATAAASTVSKSKSTANTAKKRANTSTNATTVDAKKGTSAAKTKSKVTKPAPAKDVKKTTKAAPKKETKTSAKSTVKKAAASKKSDAKKLPNGTAMNTSKKRKADDEEIDVRQVKRAAKEETATVVTKGPVINEPPTQRLDVLVFGEGSAGELGLGTVKGAVDVKRPRLNPNLLADKVGVVQVIAGGMHVLALTADNKILSWGVNDSGALGRDTTWDGGLKDMDAEDDKSDDDSDDDTGMNPKEATPGEVDFSAITLPAGTRWVQVAAGDSCSLALTDDGKVYGWGSFRSNEGAFGFTPTVDTASRPIPIPELKNIVALTCGSNHVLALDKKGAVFAWGSGQQNQLGRRVVERNKRQTLTPREVGMPRGAKNNIKAIASGHYHSFAIANNNNVYSWGLNNYGETGIIQSTTGETEAVVPSAKLVEALVGKNVISIAGGGHHSIAATADGECLAWGRVDAGQCGISESELKELGDVVQKNERGQLALLSVPTKVTNVKGKAVLVAAGTEHSFAVTEEGKAYSCGFSANYQTGLGTDDDVSEMTLIDNTAARERKINGIALGGQFSVLTAAAKQIA